MSMHTKKITPMCKLKNSIDNFISFLKDKNLYKNLITNQNKSFLIDFQSENKSLLNSAEYLTQISLKNGVVLSFLFNNINSKVNDNLLIEIFLEKYNKNREFIINNVMTLEDLQNKFKLLNKSLKDNNDIPIFNLKEFFPSDYDVILNEIKNKFLSNEENYLENLKNKIIDKTLKNAEIIIPKYKEKELEIKNQLLENSEKIKKRNKKITAIKRKYSFNELEKKYFEAKRNVEQDLEKYDEENRIKEIIKSSKMLELDSRNNYTKTFVEIIYDLKNSNLPIALKNKIESDVTKTIKKLMF